MTDLSPLNETDAAIARQVRLAEEAERDTQAALETARWQHEALMTALFGETR